MESDPNFNQAEFITKANNIFIKFFSAIMQGDLAPVSHFVSEEVLKFGKDIVEARDMNGERQMYDQLNVKENNILSSEDFPDYYEITTMLTARYMDYIVKKEGFKLVSGNDRDRIEVPYKLTFRKAKTAHELGVQRKCPTCGATMDINNSGKCEYCGTIFNLNERDFVLQKLVRL